MIVKFKNVGRLGNAIFRYLACAIICIHYNGTYDITDIKPVKNSKFISDKEFIDIADSILNNKKTQIKSDTVIMDKYYQHDLIYKVHKNEIFDFIQKNPTHYILTDGIEAGDKNYEKFNINDILNTPASFYKTYKNVLHIRLEDFVIHKLYLDKLRIVNLLNKNIITNNLCIVCKAPKTDFENEYIKYIVDYLQNKNIECHLEHNDVLTDFYIMKEAEILICSKSTLSWSAAFFSNKIQKCYLPDCTVTPNITCKQPIDNTEFY